MNQQITIRSPKLLANLNSWDADATTVATAVLCQDSKLYASAVRDARFQCMIGEDQAVFEFQKLSGQLTVLVVE